MQDKIIDEEVVEVDPNTIAYKEPLPGKKIPTTYVCDNCGKKKTIRFVSVPTPASCGICTRCKKGSMYSEFITKAIKKGEFTEPQMNKLKDHAVRTHIQMLRAAKGMNKR